ncbi:hypothetical protein MKW94_028608 [Papaver nudicaule]|uniref:Uncharacterized protein n=1 Tax=Papaver nudicaule TaxID=74823 RepID=A0AA41V6I8_PAPNU|nr:hypothetical protein [Papaver nudicaule]
MVTSLVAVDQGAKSDKRNWTTWGKQLRSIIHDAEDVVDEFYLETVIQKRLLENLEPRLITSIKNKVSEPSFVHNIGVRIDDINARAKALKENKDTYGAESSLISLHQKIMARRAQIFAEVYQHNDIHEGVERQITPLLARKDGALRVISILGMGGVGKTTLSKKLYNLNNGFDCRARIYISKIYSMDDLLKRIMKQCFGYIPDATLELPMEKLFAELEMKKYLILLDDVWDTDVWDSLRSWFPDNNKGSIVLLTTRHEKVANSASSLSSNNIYNLNVINETESWQIFKDRVRPDPALESLGKEMVQKCHGLPLAIGVLVGLLSEINRQKYAWSSLKASALWLSRQDDYSYKCTGILALSYDYLPYHLKQCFLYMMLFPKDSNISVTKLFQYWIAEGFVQTSGEETLEGAAERYLEELIGRNLIQVCRLSYNGKVKSYRIHDLIRDISLAESKDVQFSQIYYSIDELYEENPESVRVAVYCGSVALNKQDFTHSFGTRIRFLMCQNAYFKKHNYFSSLCGGFKSLRVLEFSRYNHESCLIKLPKEVGKLIHLRYLSFEKTKLEQIDTSYLCKLVNLETLNLNDCVDELIMGDTIWSLHKLRYLYLKGIRTTSYKRKSHWSSVVGKLRNFQSKTDKLGIDKLENLHLLHIQAGDWMNGGRLYLRGKIHDWSERNSFPPQLCKLKLEWSWIVDDPMPILEKLPSLIFLHLGCVSYLGKKMVCSEGGFVGLQTLEIVSLKNLEEWNINKGALASLTELKIRDCKKFKMIPNGLQQLTTLKELGVANMPHQFKSRMKNPNGEDWDKINHIPSIVLA